MFRAMLLLGLVAFLTTTLAGCIVVDRDHGHGRGHFYPPGQAKKHRH